MPDCQRPIRGLPTWPKLCAFLVRDHTRPPARRSGDWPHDPGSAASSGWSVPPASLSAIPTTPVCRLPLARSLLRTGRFAAAHFGVPTSLCSGLAWTSPRFWSPERGDTPETAASDAAAPLFRTSRKRATSVANAARLVRGSASRQTPAQVDRSNIHAGISSHRSDSDAFRSQRKTTPPGRSIAT